MAFKASLEGGADYIPCSVAAQLTHRAPPTGSGVDARFRPFGKRWPAVVAVVVTTAAVAGALAVYRGTSVSAESSPSGFAIAAAMANIGSVDDATVATMHTEVHPAEVQPVVQPGSPPACGPGETATGATLAVTATALNVRVGPGTKFKPLINQRASKDSGRTVYVQLDHPTKVFEVCRSGGWSQVQVVEPFASTGWVANRYLAEQ